MGLILLATDGSDPSLRAEAFLSEHLGDSDDRVLVVSVARAPARALGYTGSAGREADMIGRGGDELREHLAGDALGVAEDAADRLRAQGRNAEVAAPVGNPGVKICELAEREHADCVVMGRRGLGGAGELLLGSVSRYVIHHAPCAVLVVPRPHDLEQESP